MERERELRVLIELRGEGEGSRILGQPGRRGGEMGEGGDGARLDEVEGYGRKNRESGERTSPTDARG